MAAKPVRLLILDDDINLRKTLADALALEGFRADGFKAGKDALEAAKRENYAAALIDLKLADMSGLEVLRSLKEQSPDIECILLTGYASQESAIGAINLGAFAYFQKPYNIDQLILAIRRAVEKRDVAISLHESEEMHRQISQVLSDYEYRLIVEEDKTIRREWTAESFSRITGYSNKEINKPGGWTKIIHPEDRPIMNKRSEDIYANKENVCEYRIICKDGTIKWLQDFCKPVWDESKNRVVKAYGAAKDISERKKYEKEILRRTEQISIINEMGQALAQTMDLDGIFHLAYHFVGELVDRPNFSVSLVNFDNHSLEAAFLNSDGYEFDVSLLPPLPINRKKKTGRSGAINTAKPVIIDTLTPEAAKAEKALIVDSKNIPKSALYVPMVVDGRVIGLLEVLSYKRAAYDKEAAELLGTAANAIGLAIANSRLFQNLTLQVHRIGCGCQRDNHH